MNITRVSLTGECKELFDLATLAESSVQVEIDNLQSEYQNALCELAKVKEKILPFKKQLAPISELKAAIASRSSRVKYYPQFATRNFDESKDQEFLKFAKNELSPDKV